MLQGENQSGPLIVSARFSA